MGSRRKQKGEDFKQEDVLQAVVIADSFNVKFAPVTKDKPRVLLPLANIPLLEYTLEFLCSSGIQEVILFCCAHASQIKAYLNQSKWEGVSSPMEVVTVVSEDCRSLGDAIRDLDAKSLISNDFVLINGDTVSNVPLKPIIEAHKARRLKDKSVLMTLVFRAARPGHSVRCREDEVALALRPDNQQILTYHKMDSTNKFDVPLSVLTEHKHVRIRYDLQDSHMSICSPHVPPLFTDNFDFFSRDDFVRGILMDDEIFGHSIHLHELEEEYAARVSNLHMYDTISQDVLNRWVYPLVPDNVVTDRSCDKYRYGRHNVYLHPDVTLARDCKLQQNVLIGKGSTIDEHTDISDSVIGQNCKIGRHVTLSRAYIWDNVTIADNCVVTSCVLDTGVQLRPGVTLQPGCVLAANVVVGPDVSLAPGTLLSAEPPEDEFGEEGDDTAECAEVGAEGRGYVYRLPADSDNDDASDASGGGQDVWGLTADTDDDDDDDTDSVLSDTSSADRGSPAPDETKLFYNEVLSTLERARTENIGNENMILEINSLKHAYGIQMAELNQLLTRAIMSLPLQDDDEMEPSQYFNSVKKNFQKFLLPLLKNYLRSEESQMDCIMELEELSLSLSVCQRSLVNVLHFLYEEDVFSEDVILRWHRSPDTTADNGAARTQIRAAVNTFIQWLKEAEEESDEDSDDDSD